MGRRDIYVKDKRQRELELMSSDTLFDAKTLPEIAKQPLVLGVQVGEDLTVLAFLRTTF